MNQAHGAAPLVETRSFDHVPESERSGTLGTQLRFWFMLNATLLTAFTGAVGPAAGLGLPTTLLAIITGTIFGTLFQAFHGAQGPHMGLPQMIQSRVQFGSRGAIIPIGAATVVYLGFSLFYIQSGSSAITAATGLDGQIPLATVFLGAAAVLLAIFGIRWILRAEGIIAWVMLANLVVLTVAVFVTLPVGALLSDWTGTFLGFLIQFGAAALYQLAIAPQVSDYTRYLPTRTSSLAVSATVFVGTASAAIWLESLGAVITLSHPDLDVITGIQTTGDDLYFGIGTITMVIAVIVGVVTAAVTFYSASVSFLSILEAFRKLWSTFRLRAWTISLSGVLVIALALTLTSDTVGAFGVFLAILGYLLIPWTAVNLVDYYLVRRGMYSITDIMRQDGGIYGRWGLRGMVAYAVGFVTMVPFFSTAVYTGPLAALLGGADISYAVGLIVSSVLYLLLMRRVDLAAERKIVAASPLHTPLREISLVRPVSVTD